ncbi:NDP-hexose 2,3-dehydratase family protein [Teredinibacter haidensis]|uniref:NDP-hexose 2,3-dehydratase family protein n=1 Tax=Teredinibacter haidensis TaxID=2731755 RepID=UPI000948EB52|nr:NDP-hexose 2,3-dehydratase family protein [Teredinibacter haidensis]
MSAYSNRLKQYLEGLSQLGFSVDEYSEFKFEGLEDFSNQGSLQDIVDWYWVLVNASTMKMQRIPLSECREWSLNEKTGCMEHSSGEFFRVEGYRITGTGSREVTAGWDQPFLTQQGFDGGILGLVRQRIDGVPHYLVEAKEEPGNYNVAQISPTVQATFSNLNRAHKGKQTNYSHLFLEPEDHPVTVLLDQWTSEDGGRLYNKRNRSMLVEYKEGETLELVSERFKWVSLYQLKKLIREHDAIVAPHIRGILSGL